MNVFCDHDFNDSVISFIKNHPEIKTVILTAVWECYVNGIHFKQEGGTTLHLKDVTKKNFHQSNLELI